MGECLSRWASVEGWRLDEAHEVSVGVGAAAQRRHRAFACPRPPAPPGPCSLDEKIRKLDEQLAKHKEAIKKCRPGPAQEAAKRRALAVSALRPAQQCRLGGGAGAPYLQAGAKKEKEKKREKKERTKEKERTRACPRRSPHSTLRSYPGRRC